MQPPVAPLHDSRLQIGLPPWTSTGIDHFGPFEIRGRGKIWGLIFICLTSRAIHLEHYAGPGAEPFLQALDRFISRRGKPEELRSDRGSSFLNLAKQQNKTAQAYAEELAAAVLKNYRIELKFNPPGAPHFGGSWERMIQEVKKILKSTAEAHGKWRQDDFVTFLARAEGILNRRPICFMEDGNALTPAQIVAPHANNAVGPPRGAPQIKSLEQLRNAEKLFWNRWIKFYLPSISTRQVLGRVRNDDLRPGDKVLLREGSNPLVDTWNIATIVETYPGKDGVVRSALLDVKGNRVIRDVTRIAIIDGPVLQRRKALPPPSGGVLMPRTEPYGTRSTVRATAAKLDEESKAATVEAKSKPATEHDTITCPLPASQSEASPEKGIASVGPPAQTSDQSGAGKPAASPSSSPAGSGVYKPTSGAQDFSRDAGSEE